MAINKFIVLVSVLFLSLTANADDVPNTFQAGEPIVASDVNENFTDLQNQVNTLKAQLDTQNSTETPREFVGITTSSTNGVAGGRFGINKMCEDEYAGSSICFDYEAVYADPSLITSDLWIEPSSFKIIPNDAYTSYKIYDYIEDYNQINSGTTNCSNWTRTGGHWSYKGAVLNQDARVKTASCSDDNPVACCK